MDLDKFGKIVGLSVATAEPVTAEQLTSVMTDQELLEAVAKRGLTPQALGHLATTSLDHSTSPETLEAPRITPEYLLDTLDTALATYDSQVSVVNAARASVITRRGQERPAQLEVIKHRLILSQVETMLDNETFMAELQAQADYFTAHPEQSSPDVGFDLCITPEGLTAADEEAIAYHLQPKLNPIYSRPYIRPAKYNDKRTSAATGSGFMVAVAPRHCNVRAGKSSVQTAWMKAQNNKQNSATKLQTATDGQALAQINNLLLNGKLNDPSTRFHTSHFRRYDQDPVAGCVSDVFVCGDGKMELGRSVAEHAYAASRVLMVPKA